MIIITGFKPFDLEKENPSWEAVKKLPDHVSGIPLHKLQLPVSYNGSFEMLKTKIESVAECRAIVCVGQAKGRTAITPEAIGINRMYASIPDETGQAPFHLPIIEKASPAYFSTLPTLEITEALRSEGIPAAISYHAGTYVCNSLLYQLLHYITVGGKNIPSGFIHVPLSAQQVISTDSMTPSLPLEQITQGLYLALQKTVESIT